MSGPLAGIRVIDITTVLLGPYGTQLLGDMGADVIKVEAPPKGDSTRFLGSARSPGMAGAFMNMNRNKRSIALDLKQDAAKAALRALIETADVLVHNMRPQKIAKLGFGYDDVAAIKPDIVYVGAYGFSQKGPYAARPAYDDMIQAGSGLASLFQRTTGEPRYVPTVMVDKLTGLQLSQAVAMALLHRERTGEGQFVEVPMFETLVSFLMVEHIFDAGFEPPLGEVGYKRLTTPARKPYRTADGHHICALPYTDRHWALFFEMAGRPELTDDPRFADHATRTEHTEWLYEFMAEAIATKPAEEWLAMLGEAEIPSMIVNDIADLMDDPHLKAVGMFRKLAHPSEGDTVITDIPIAYSKSPGEIRLPAPRYGENGPELLRELGYAEADIDAMRAAGALLQQD